MSIGNWESGTKANKLETVLTLDLILEPLFHSELMMDRLNIKYIVSR